MAYVYGKDLVYNLFTFEDQREISDLPTQTVTGYLFENAPSRAQAASGEGALETFTQSLTEGQKIQLSIPAISDPYPNEYTDFRHFWVAVNFVLEAGEDVQTVVRAIKVNRVAGHDVEIGVNLQSIIDIYPDVLQYLNDTQINALIALARLDLLDELSNKGFDWSRIHKPDQLFNALLSNTLVYIYNSQIQDAGDRFSASSEKAQTRYESLKNNLKLQYDSTLSGIDTEKVEIGGTIWLSR